MAFLVRDFDYRKMELESGIFANKLMYNQLTN